jgi:hypothetical protein
MFLDGNVIIAFSEAIGLGLGLVFMGYLLGRAKSNQSIQNFINELIYYKIIDKLKFEQWLEKKHGKKLKVDNKK